MALRSFIFVIIIVLISMYGCGEDDDLSSVSSSPGYLDGATLLGFVDNRTLDYVQTDTIITFDPSYNLSVETSTQKIRLSVNDNEWIVYNDNTPLVNLRPTSESILQNGYWRYIDGHDSLFYIPVPPVVMSRSLSVDTSWSGYTPSLPINNEETIFPFYYANFGFYFERRFIGTENILVPAGSFDTYCFEVDLFVNPYDSLPTARTEEYYASGIGLIRLNFKGGSLNRTLSLIDYYQEATR